MKTTIKVLTDIAFILLIPFIIYSCKLKKDIVYQTIKKTCNYPECYYALYTTVYYHDAIIKEWIDDAKYLTPVQVKGRKIEGDSRL